MNLTINGHHVEITPAIRDYVDNKLQRAIRHADQVLDLNVTLSVDNQAEKGLRQKAGCSVRFKGRDIYVETADADMYAAIDSMADKLVRQIAKYKEMGTDRKRSADPLKHVE